MRSVLELMPDLVICGEAEDGPSAMKAIHALEPDLAVVDLSLKKGNGFDLIKQLQHRFPKVGILVFSMHDEVSFVERAFHAGARGYLTKDEGAETLIPAIRQVLSGKPFLSAAMTARMGPSLPAFWPVR
jgi:DNA-binding NarL/FixJ family response regulator